jgi:fumarate hydratase class I
MPSPKPDYKVLEQAIRETITAAATRLPADVTAALERACAEETQAAAKAALQAIVENIGLAAADCTPICQDTGFPTFWFDLPKGYDRQRIVDIVLRCLAEATDRGILRPNAVDPVTGKNSGNNSGALFPAFYFDEADGPELKLKLLLKGGGSENVSCQYRLPHAPIGAGRDLAGVEKVVLHGIFEAQGFGCGPGIISVAIGSDRAQGYSLAKKGLMRPLPDSSPVPQLAAMEQRVCEKANRLDIGAMGFGGRTTVLGVKIAAAHRHPASYFVTLAYGCWALRRKVLVFGRGGYTLTDY